MPFEPVDMGDPELNREINTMLARADTSPPAWWWLSFLDHDRSEGEKFLGACLVWASNVGTAIERAWTLGINPGGEVATWGPFDEADLPPNLEREVLLDRAQAEGFGS